MTFFESLLALLLLAIVLLQVSRRMALPYPTMLAAAGVAVALVPGSPTIRLDPETALALFIAPALLDAAYDFPIGAVRKLWRPLLALAVFAVLLTAGTVAWIGVALAGLPPAAAIALGAIVAPPDAAAATAMLRGLSLPRRTVAVLTGESLLNDATALLLFAGAVAIQGHGGIDAPVALHLTIAAPGGVLLGVAFAWLALRIFRFVSATLGGNLLEFVVTFSVWVVADRLQLSAVLAVVAFAMTIARGAGQRQPARARVHSYAVWESVVFLLNVLAFLLMGMQARTIVGAMPAARLHEALIFAAAIVAAVVLVRLIWVIGFNRLAAHFKALRGDYEPPNLRQGILVGWSGMRGLVTLATAFALPASFPQRDLIVLTALAVVLVTLVVQGATLVPVIRLLGLDRDRSGDDERLAARVALADAALDSLSAKTGVEADQLRHALRIERDRETDSAMGKAADQRRKLGLAAIGAQRARLDGLRAEHRLSADAFNDLQEELDWKELAISCEGDVRIEET